MYNSPKKAKRLYFDVIPKHVDDYLGLLGKLDDENDAQKLENPVWHIHRGNAPRRESQLSFSLLLNLASACNTEDPDVLWGFISRYDDGVSPGSSPIVDRLSNYAISYYKDFVKPEKRYRAPTDAERSALEDLVESLLGLPIGADAAAIQNEVFLVGKKTLREDEIGSRRSMKFCLVASKDQEWDHLLLSTVLQKQLI